MAAVFTAFAYELTFKFQPELELASLPTLFLYLLSNKRRASQSTNSTNVDCILILSFCALLRVPVCQCGCVYFYVNQFRFI